MSLATGRYQLANALKTLQVRWDVTQDHWRDAVRDDFDRAYWTPLAARVPAVLTAMDTLDQVLVRLRQECGDGSGGIEG